MYILNWIDTIRVFFETYGFEVVSRISDKVGMRASKLRLLFIYSAFVTLGVIFALYLFMAFVLWVKDGFIKKRPSVFDL